MSASDPLDKVVRVLRETTPEPILDSESVSESVVATGSSPIPRKTSDPLPIPTDSRRKRIGRESESVAAGSASVSSESVEPLPGRNRSSKRVSLDDPSELAFQTLAEFASEDEPSAETIVGSDADDAAFVADGTVVVFGKGGAGKTILTLDLTFHIATGMQWQGLDVPKPRRVLVIENDGPRGRFRRKVRAKREGWQGPDPEHNAAVLTKPWGKLRLSREDHRAALAAYIVENEIEVLVAGPIVTLGMIGGGTPDEVAAFEAHLQALRELVGRPLLVILLHHTNQRGQVSGAWDRVPDTLIFVVNTGRGTRLTWQKARDSSTLHATSWKLKWADGMTFERDDSPDVTEDDIEEGILTSVRADPGSSWTIIAKPVTGNAKLKAAVRDRLLAEGALVNRGRGQAYALWHAEDVSEEDDQTALDEVPT